MMKFVDGGVCAPKGFKANGIFCGLKKNPTKKDLALIVSDTLCTTASVYTKNLVKGAPIYVTQKHSENGVAQAIICNSGNANTCNDNGIEIALEMCKLVSEKTNIAIDNVLVSSTGVIGQKLSIDPIKNGIDELVNGLASDEEHSNLAWEGIRTTDTFRKQISIEFLIGGKTCRMGGICKGSGMIHPNMATMLGFITTDVAISSEMIKKALKEDIEDTFNMVSVDGDTSTNDTVTILANGLAGNEEITSEGEDFNSFKKALNLVNTYLSKAIAKDGEGATKLLICEVLGAKTKNDAKIVAKSVICSSLLKAAMFGADANWGRVLCAIGYSGADVDINKVDVEFESEQGIIPVCKNGAGIDFSEEIAKKILLEDEIIIRVRLNDKDGSAQAFGCDLTYDYVKINGDYRS
ncbi:MAG: bifunctional ornithine acetyltransferase/N-acetylglutamate synthase [Anaeroplasmataceae bacterium]